MDSLDRLRRHDIPLTLHAGEAGGPKRILEALDLGATRIGHGVRIIEDCIIRDGRIVDVGPVAKRVHEASIVLEVCPTSNEQTQGWGSADHPLLALANAGFAVTVNPDNRTISGITASSELTKAHQEYGLDASQLHTCLLTAAQAAFVSDDKRASLASRVVLSTKSDS